LRREPDEDVGCGGDSAAKGASAEAMNIVPRLGVVQMLIFLNEDIANKCRQSGISRIQIGGLFFEVSANGAFNGSGANVDASSAEGGCCSAEQAPSDRPDGQGTAWRHAAFVHSCAKCRAMSRLMTQCVFEPWN